MFKLAQHQTRAVTQNGTSGFAPEVSDGQLGSGLSHGTPFGRRLARFMRSYPPAAYASMVTENMGVY